MQNTPACLLSEGLPPGQSLRAHEIPGWQDLLEQLTVQGSDVRSKWSTERYLPWLRLERQEARLEAEYKKAKKQSFLEMASIVNDAYLSGIATVRAN